MHASPDSSAFKSRYELLKPLGGSLLGRTLLARDHQSGEQVVLKELELTRAEDWKEIELFERGAKTLKSLNHPQIPKFYDTFFDEDRTRLYLVQEFIEGVNLKQKLAKEGPFDEVELRAFLTSVLSILDYLHSFSPPVIHRDIKPSNIMQRPDGTFALIDFDVVQTVLPDAIGGSTVVGTSGYMPPEQLTGHAAPASDIYSLGITAIQLSTGADPTSLPMRRGELLFKEHSPLTASLNHLLEDMTAANLRSRFDTARAALDAMELLEAPPRIGEEMLLHTSDAQDIERYCHAGRVGDWGEITLKDRELQIVFFSTSKQAILPTIFVALGVIHALIYLLAPGLYQSIGLDPAGWPSAVFWISLAPLALALLLGPFLIYTEGNQAFETGIEQTLTLSPGEIRLVETNKFKRWGGGRRALKSWVLPREDFRAIYRRVAQTDRYGRLAEANWQRASRFEGRESQGLVFLDRFGGEHLAGEDWLLYPDKDGFDQRTKAVERAHHAATAYLGAQGQALPPAVASRALSQDNSDIEPDKMPSEAAITTGVEH